jgi:hypothetical protein
MPNHTGIPGSLTPVVLTPPVTTDGGVTTDYISLKKVHRVTIVAVFTQAVGHATGIDPVQATAVDGTGAKAITNTVPIWANTDISLDNILTRQTDAITYNLGATAKNQIVTMDIDPAGFDVANGFDVLGVTIDDSSQATNFVSVVAWLDMRYPNTKVIED